MGESISSNNRRIARNTFMLYIRMAFVMLANLFVVRVILNVLGEEDYGVYNVVGGIVVMFSFLSRVLASASQRYFAFELGRNDYKRLNKVFNITLLLYVFLSVAIIVLGETVGLWFLKTQMTIPANRMGAALWVYQFSVVAFVVSMIATPFQAIIIASEKMSLYAYLGILEAILNLALAGVLYVVSGGVDLLILYAALMLLVTLIVNGVYFVYVRLKIRECALRYYWDGKLMRELLSYSGWNLFGSIAGVISNQGINILINMFFNPVVNAARGLAYQINTALNSFASNFYTAVRPQVTKYYANGEREACFNLVFSSSRLTYYLLLFVAVPVLVFADEILGMWLVDVPEHTSLFVRLVILVALVDSVSNPLMTLAQATGNVKVYQMVVGLLLIMNLPLSWMFLSNGYGAEYTMYVAIFVAVISLAGRLAVLKNLVDFPVWLYCKDVLLKITSTSVVALLLSVALYVGLVKESASLFLLVVIVALSILVTSLTILYVGVSKSERQSVYNAVKSKLK